MKHKSAIRLINVGQLFYTGYSLLIIGLEAMHSALVVFLLLAGIAIMLPVLLGGIAKKTRLESKPLMTANETEFFYRLQKALPEYYVFPQVALGAILKAPTGISRKEHYSLRGRFSQKIADYVICARNTLDIIAIIELDDRTHTKDKDNERDKMVESAGYRVLRFNSRHKPSEAEIARHFDMKQHILTKREPQF